jgi:hypothetical protein
MFQSSYDICRLLLESDNIILYSNQAFVVQKGKECVVAAVAFNICTENNSELSLKAFI